MSESTRCWWCMGKLVGPGGVKGKEPLFYRVVEVEPGRHVRVHVTCEIETRAEAKRRALTAAPPDENVCPACKGSGDKQVYDASKGPDGDTSEIPCDECGGTGAL